MDARTATPWTSPSALDAWLEKLLRALLSIEDEDANNVETISPLAFSFPQENIFFSHLNQLPKVLNSYHVFVFPYILNDYEQIV